MSIFTIGNNCNTFFQNLSPGTGKVAFSNSTCIYNSSALLYSLKKELSSDAGTGGARGATGPSNIW